MRTSAAILAFIVSVSAANAVTYECEFNAKSNKEWIPEIVFLSRKNGVVAVLDPIIDHSFEEPQIGKVVNSNKKRTTCGWALRKFKTAGNQFVSGLQ